MPPTAQALVPQAVSPSTLIDVAATYLRPEDIEQLEQAFALAARAHEGQYRKSGEPYITHPLSVATILAEWHLDPQALMAALLHDTVEDTSTTSVQIAQQFGKSVSELVDGVSKLDRLEFQTEQQAQAENFRKMLLAMARDVRVILIKLADRLHNMRTLDAMDPGKQRRIARETLDIYSPIANRLGLHSVFQELQDLGFRYLFPNRYQVLTKAIRSARGNRREVVGKILTAITQRLTSFGVEAQVSGREKHLSSIYNKMLDKSLSFSQVLDIYGFRILVKDVAACYLALGALHTLYKPIPGKFKDYIAIPKANGYQSLHTTLFGPFGTPIEIQIRTHDMHKIAEAGVASHWLYKSSDTPLSDVQQKTHQWLQSLLEIQTESGDAVEFLEHLKVDLFPDEVYVFTPKGNIKSLPKGSTPVDFAYDVHTDIGNRCVAAKINNELAPLRTVLSNGDRVEIITEENAAPNPAWLNYVATAKARSKIRHYLRTMLRDESVALGERLLNQALRALKVDPAGIKDSQWEQLLKGDRCKTRDEVLAEIGLGRRLNIVVARGLLPRTEGQSLEGQGSITIRGSEGVAVQFAHCCRPIPGDPIIGIIRKGQGLLIHTQDCRAIRQFRSDPDKWVDVEWENDSGKLFDVAIKLMVVNRRGVLATVASAIADAQSNIDSVSITKPDGTYTEINFTVQVRDRSHLATLLHHLREIPEVVRITRVQS
ncbi:MAG: bifunctional (p)ppGpp synthetase/guanosine-3',5'-bis(diphosphate) 3'-pyrophosphohydrolase [Betaproteobacteria bacterium]|nr:bifunctional (p)ppGpp synthetase/guanosine-3',5'-bis(diphosphate) 3'-pyrophosphohydrolase [Betaproteobacteria bacterium]MDE2623904.1 bifunctional (p)ppGpp synthetase/guanosine-3',5'-bis(diphosphate) 3'-pyrophosphohydrolase [Betaproteobacteria bacterium]